MTEKGRKISRLFYRLFIFWIIFLVMPSLRQQLMLVLCFCRVFRSQTIGTRILTERPKVFFCCVFIVFEKLLQSEMVY